MKVVIFGATGMVGQSVLRECLRDDRVDEVLVVGRLTVGQQHPKLREILHADMFDVSPIGDQLAGYDACFFCLGVSSVGMKADKYRRLTYDLTLAVAGEIAERSPGSTFIYVTGQGTDSSEQGRVRWARVKGATENALRELPLRSYFFRPGYIHPLHRITSKTRLYHATYRIAAVFYPVLRRLFPRSVTTTEAIGRAMIAVAEGGYDSQILENPDINAAGRGFKPK